MTTIEFPDGELGLWTIYERPRDYPNGYVARLWKLGTPTNTVLHGDTLEEVRFLLDKCYPGLVRIPRSPRDDPQIVETWL